MDIIEVLEHLKNIPKDEFEEKLLKDLKKIIKSQVKIIFKELHQIFSRNDDNISLKLYFENVKEWYEEWYEKMKNENISFNKTTIRSKIREQKNRKEVFTIIDKFYELKRLIDSNDYNVLDLINQYENLNSTNYYSRQSRYDLLKYFEFKINEEYRPDDGIHDVMTLLVSYWSKTYNVGYIKNPFRNKEEHQSFVDNYMFFEDLNEMNKNFKKYSIDHPSW